MINKLLIIIGLSLVPLAVMADGITPISNNTQVQEGLAGMINDEGKVTTFTLANDASPTDGQVLSWNAGDTVTWENDAGASGGDSVSINGSPVVDPDFVSTGQVSFTDTSNIITGNITNDSIVEADINSTNAPTDNYVLSYNLAGTNFTWVAAAAASFTDIDTDYGAETVTSAWNFIESGLGGLTNYDLSIGDTTTPDYGVLRIGDSTFGRTSYSGGSLDLGGALLFNNQGALDAGNDPGIQFAFVTGGSSMRLAVPEDGAGNATAMFRSVTIAGPMALNNNVVLGDTWTSYNANLDFDTGGSGADAFIQDDLEVEGEIYTHGTILMDADDANQLTLAAPNMSGSETITFPEATGTVVLKDTTDALTNKSINANGTGNALTNIDEDNCLDGSDLVRSGVGIVIDGGGSAITTGIACDIEIPFNCTLIRASILADQSTSMVVDFWLDSYANFPPTNADSITDAGTSLTVSASTKTQDTSLTSWTVALTAGDILRVNVDSNDNATRVTIPLVLER